MMHFQKQANAALRSVRSRIDLGLWAVSVLKDGRLTAVAVDDRLYGIRPGDSIPFSDSLCSRMLNGDVPPIAPVVDDVPAYADAPVRATLPIGAYAGIRVPGEDEDVHAVLEGIDPSPQPAGMTSELPLLETFAAVIGVAFGRQGAIAHSVLGKGARCSILADPVTGLANGLGWQGFLQAEQAQQATRAHPTTVLVVKLQDPEPGEQPATPPPSNLLLETVAGILVGCVGPTGLAARLDDMCFGVLIVDDTGDDGAMAAECIRRNLGRAAISARVSASLLVDGSPASAVGDSGRDAPREALPCGTPPHARRFSPTTVTRWESSGRPFVFVRREEPG